MGRNYRALNVAQFNLVIPLTQTAPAALPIFQKNIGGANGGLITSLSLAFNTAAQQGARIYVSIDGVDIYPNDYQQPSQTFNTFNYIQSGDSWDLDPNAQLKVFAFNSNSASTTMLMDIIATVKQKPNF